MSTNGRSPGQPNGLPNGFRNGHHDDLSNGYHINGGDAYSHAPPSRPSSPVLDAEIETTPRVLLNARLAEAPSRQELLQSIPTSQPPFFSDAEAYTHVPVLLARGPARGPTRDGMLGQRSVNGRGPSTPASATSRYLTVPGQEDRDRISVTLEGLQISSCGDEMFIPTPFNTPAVSPRTSPTAPRRYTSRAPRHDVSAASGIEVPPNAPVTPISSPGATARPTPAPTAPAAVPRYQPANFGSPLHPTRRNGGGKKKQKGKLTNGKGKGKTKAKGKAKDKMLDDASLAVAHGESPIYTENIAAILQHPEAVAVLSSAPDIEAVPVADLLTSGDMKEAIAGFVNNGKSGFNDPDWLEEAAVASACREAGEYNELMDLRFEETWAEEGGEEYSDSD